MEYRRMEVPWSFIHFTRKTMKDLLTVTKNISILRSMHSILLSKLYIWTSIAFKYVTYNKKTYLLFMDIKKILTFLCDTDEEIDKLKKLWYEDWDSALLKNKVDFNMSI